MSLLLISRTGGYKITNHGYENFIFWNNENKKVTYFLITVRTCAKASGKRVFEESKIEKGKERPHIEVHR